MSLLFGLSLSMDGLWVLDGSSLGFVLSFLIIYPLGQFIVVIAMNRGLVKMASLLFYFVL